MNTRSVTKRYIHPEGKEPQSQNLMYMKCMRRLINDQKFKTKGCFIKKL